MNPPTWQSFNPDQPDHTQPKDHTKLNGHHSDSLINNLNNPIALAGMLQSSSTQPQQPISSVSIENYSSIPRRVSMLSSATASAVSGNNSPKSIEEVLQNMQREQRYATTNTSNVMDYVDELTNNFNEIRDIVEGLDLDVDSQIDNFVKNN